MRVQSLHDLGELDISFWHKEMLYPFEHKFVLFEDIKDCLTGYARFIEFRCFQQGLDGFSDPSMDGAFQKNWILSMTEGEYYKGNVSGFSRTINAFNGYCKLGYYQEGKPYGKWCEFKSNGTFWQPEGIWDGSNLIRQKKIKDFLQNEGPETVKDPQGEDLIMIKYEQQRPDRGSLALNNKT